MPDKASSSLYPFPYFLPERILNQNALPQVSALITLQTSRHMPISVTVSLLFDQLSFFLLNVLNQVLNRTDS